MVNSSLKHEDNTGMSQTANHFHKSVINGISPLSETLSGTTASLRQTDVSSETGRIKMMNFLELLHPTAADIPTPNGTKAPIKTLFDHGHNIRNKMVIYDDDPRVEIVMKAALDRHHGKLKDHEEFLKKTEDIQQELN
jgi:hypothetical protein